MNVTVTEAIEHSADITPEMVEAYALSHGWTKVFNGRHVWAYLSPNDRTFSIRYREPNEAQMIDAIENIAAEEHRKTHLVLADIASGT